MAHPHSVIVATCSYHNGLQTPACVAIFIIIYYIGIMHVVWIVD